MGQETKTIPKNYTVLEDHWADHQSMVVEVEGEIVEHIVSVLFDPGSTHIYITLGLVEMCTLKKSKNKGSWLVQIATGTRRKVSKVVRNVHWSWMG